MPASKTRSTKARKPKAAPAADVTLSSVYAAKASKLNIDTTRAAKLVRSRLRSNFTKVCEMDSRIATAKKAANDGNRWPKVITRDVAEFVLGGGKGSNDD